MNIEDSHKDLRVRLTHQMLIEAFLQLRREKPLRKITVRELCERAGVGRGTFYAHFLDVYDLNEKLETHLLNEFTQMLKERLPAVYIHQRVAGPVLSIHVGAGAFGAAYILKD